MFNGNLSEEDGYVVVLLCEFSVSHSGFLVGTGQAVPPIHRRRYACRC